jgi:hypothetical protein
MWYNALALGLPHDGAAALLVDAMHRAGPASPAMDLRGREMLRAPLAAAVAVPARRSMVNPRPTVLTTTTTRIAVPASDPPDPLVPSTARETRVGIRTAPHNTTSTINTCRSCA